MYNNKLSSQYQREHAPVIEKHPDRLIPKIDYGKQPEIITSITNSQHKPKATTSTLTH
jgi:hypothetical protein